MRDNLAKHCRRQNPQGHVTSLVTLQSTVGGALEHCPRVLLLLEGLDDDDDGDLPKQYPSWLAFSGGEWKRPTLVPFLGALLDLPFPCWP